MKKNKLYKIFVLLLVAIFVLGAGFTNLTSFKGNAVDRKQEQKATNKKIIRIRKYFGKKDSTGQDYSLESTTGVGAVTDNGMDVNNIKPEDKLKYQGMKENLFNNSQDAIIKSIEKVINSPK